MRHLLRTALSTLLALLVAGVAAAQVPYEVLHEFPPLGPVRPLGLIKASDGSFIGATAAGGIANRGTVFRITADGVVTTLHEFTGNSGLPSTDGAYPASGVIEGSDGNYYGSNDYPNGTLFRVTPDGTLTTLYSARSFTEGPDIDCPCAPLVEASDGNFYGTSVTGGIGIGSSGTIFRMTPAGVVTILKTFVFSGPDGRYPFSALTQGSDGHLYGTTTGGGITSAGTPGHGTVFRMTLAGELTVLHTFSGPDGAAAGPLVQASDGNFYGVTEGGWGTVTAGTIFRMTPAGAVTVLHAFDGGADGGRPVAALREAGAGVFYGTSFSGGLTPDGSPAQGTLFRITSTGAFTLLHTFLGGSGGGGPVSPLLDNGDGYLFGVTLDWGSPSRSGTFYKTTVDGDVSIVHVFRRGPEGTVPAGALIQATDGDFYGMTSAGGDFGNGTIFKMGSDGTTTVLHQFNYFDGATPAAGLVQATDGNFYGTTLSGGVANLGVAFRLTPAGTLTVLHEFGVDPPDVRYAFGQLVQADDGHLYGTSFHGGATGQYGSVFRMTTDGTVTIVHSFTGGAGGGNPVGGVIQAADGSLYGTTVRGGSTDAGTLFKLTLPGDFAVLHEFGANGDGAYPVAPPIQTADGMLYGTTLLGGSTNNGTVYRMSDEGAFALLHSFTNGADGARPAAPLLQAVDGALYGTAGAGGASGGGTIFKLGASGILLTLHAFEGTFTGRPSAALVQAANGDFYGTVLGSRKTSGGLGNGGAVFRLGNVACQDTLALTYANNTLTLNFMLMAPANAVWTSWLTTNVGSTQMWSVPIPALPTPTPVSVPLSPFPKLGTVGVYSTLSTPAFGTICAEWQTIDTSAVP